MWPTGGWDRVGPQRGGGGIWNGVISEAHSLNNWEAELRGDGFYYEFNPFREEADAHVAAEALIL